MQINTKSSTTAFSVEAVPPLAPLNYAQCILVGGSPKFALKRDGKLVDLKDFKPIKIGSDFNGYNWKEKCPPSSITVDNGMLRLNPRAYTCRQSAAAEINQCFQHVIKNFAGCEVVVENGPGDVYLKVYEHGQTPWPPDSHYSKCLITLAKEPEVIVEMLDMLLGNTCVLLDRSKRVDDTYGKAGAYELIPHGITYKVLSNFWLRSYPLMSFVTGMSRVAMLIVVMSDSKPGLNYVDALRKAVDRADIIKAINTNDKELALANWKKIAPIYMQIASNHNALPLKANNLDRFLYVVKKGYKNWFRKDIFTHWGDANTYAHGWERFLQEKVNPSFFSKIMS